MSDYALKNNDGNGDSKGQLDKKDFEAFFRHFYADLCNFAHRYVSSRDVAEDIVQSVFLNIWEQRAIWQDFKSAKGYLYKSVRNEVLNHIKHEKVKRESRPEIRLRLKEWRTNFDLNPGDKRKVRIIRRAVDQLPEKCREIYQLSRENGLTYREIASILDLSVKTVETQMGRALKSIRSFVADHWDLPAFLIILLPGL